MKSVFGHGIVAGVATALLLYGATPSVATDRAPRSGAPVALILPLKSPTLGMLADFVRQGMLAAAKADPREQLAVAIYPTNGDPDTTSGAYDQALADGSRLIIGPLTRSGVSTIAQRMQPGVPVLALNTAEGDASLPENMYAFSLQVEAEARQIARMVFADGRRSALTIADDGLQSRRIQAAFADELVRQGGRVAARFVYSTSNADLLALRESAASGHADAIFLALDAAHARLVRPYLDGPAQVYATSQIHQGSPDRFRDAELNGVRFADMPWFLEPDHPAVMTYARTDAQLPAASDGERLYAFGIDAYRIGAVLLGDARVAREPLDGVTGRIHLTGNRHFVRELTPAQFADGRAAAVAVRH